MSPGSSLPGRGFRPAPLGAASRVLQKDRAEFNQAQRALAPGDDGVHAWAIDVVGAGTAVAIAVERRRITAGAAITLAGDEIDEGRFLCLLQLSPQCDCTFPLSRAEKQALHDRLWAEYTVSIERSQEAKWGGQRKMPVQGQSRAPFGTRRLRMRRAGAGWEGAGGGGQEVGPSDGPTPTAVIRNRLVPNGARLWPC